MNSRNPILSRKGAFSRGTAPMAGPSAAGYAPPGVGPYGATADELRRLYGMPAATAAQMGRMTLDDVVMRTGMCLLVLAVAGAAAWALVDPLRGYGVAVGAALVAMVVGLVVSFRRSTNPVLILGYAALEGVFLGTVSHALELRWPGIVLQAVLGTSCVFAAMLFAYRARVIRVTPRFVRGVIAAGLGFVLLLLVNFALSLFHTGLDTLSGGLGLVIGVAGVVIGALFLTLDFAQIEAGIAGGAPQRESWIAAFGLTLSLVWIYLEILRVLAILRGDR